MPIETVAITAVVGIAAGASLLGCIVGACKGVYAVRTGAQGKPDEGGASGCQEYLPSPSSLLLVKPPLECGDDDGDACSAIVCCAAGVIVGVTSLVAAAGTVAGHVVGVAAAKRCCPFQNQMSQDFLVNDRPLSHDLIGADK